MGEAPGPGWWMASDGRYYPPELAPGQPAPVAVAVAEQTRPPVYKRAWFWVIIGLATLLTGIVIAIVLVGILIWTVPVDPVIPPGASSAPEESTLVVVESVDFATVAEGSAWSGDDWSAVVSDGALSITPTEPGGAYPFWTTMGPTSETQVSATMSWADGALDMPDGLLGGFTVVSSTMGAYGLACGNDGNVYTLMIDADDVTVLDVNGYSACLEDQFTLTMTVSEGSPVDSLSVQLPGGPSYVVFPESTLSPFNEVGFIVLAEVGTMTPGVNVHTLEVQAAQ